PDLARALELSLAACEKDVGLGCVNAGVQFADGSIATSQDRPRALSLYRRGCSLRNGKACAHLGMYYLRGEIVPRDLNRAAEHFEQSCNMGVPLGCYNLGTLFDSAASPFLREDFARAAELYQKSCGGEPRACANLGVLHEHGRGVPRDLAKSVELFA